MIFTPRLIIGNNVNWVKEVRAFIGGEFDRT
jgi:hypothetical protein